MPPKKASTASKKTTGSGHASYRDMIKDAILNLKERNGSSRQSIKKYVQANNKITLTTSAAFDAQFNKAIKSGVEKGEFTQPKGSSGPVKLAKKDEAAKAAPKKTAAKTAGTKTAATKAAPKKAAAATKKTTAKTATTKKKATAKKATSRPKANSAKSRKTPAVAPAIVEKPKVTSTTKSGRVTKTTAPSPDQKKVTKRRAPTKKA